MSEVAKGNLLGVEIGKAKVDDEREGKDNERVAIYTHVGLNYSNGPLVLFGCV